MSDTETLTAQSELILQSIEALSGEHSVNMAEIRESMDGLGERVGELEETVDGVDGDSDRPGVLTSIKALRKAQDVDDRRAWALRWLGVPALSIAAFVATWAGGEWWGGYQARGDVLGSHTTELALIKVRVGHVEELRDEMQDNQRALLEALEER